MGRKSSRETAMKLLFEIYYKPEDKEEILASYINSTNLNDNDKQYLQDIVNGTISNTHKIDNLIESHSRGWKISRFARIDLVILRLSVYELSTDTPESVVINEAVELAKKYGSDKSGPFVNGILSGIMKEGKVAQWQ